MNLEEINKEYEKFLIPKDRVPDYNGSPYDFVKGFKKFTLLKDVNTVYSDTSEIPKKQDINKLLFSTK